MAEKESDKGESIKRQIAEYVSLRDNTQNRLNDLYKTNPRAMGGVVNSIYQLEAEARKYSGEIKKLQEQLDSRSLEGKTTATLSIIGLVGGAFFLSANITGNVMGLSSSSSNIIGSVLSVIGLVACFFWVKSKKKAKVVKKKKK
jgi:hypothetical protein